MAARTLLVSDHEPIRFAFREYFELLGYHVDFAAGITQAQLMLAQSPYCLLVADLPLKGRPWQEDLELIARFHQCFPLVRVLTLMDRQLSQFACTAARFGIDAFLEKPKPLFEIAQVVSMLLQEERRDVWAS